MSQDYVTQLRLQLREAALQDERRTPLARRAVQARRGLPGPAPLVAALALALLAIAVAIGAMQLRGEPEPVKPRVIHTFTVANGLGWLAYESGSVWTGDAIKEDVLRIDPRTRKVVARIPLDGEVQIAATPGAVWALGGDLLTSGAAGPVWLWRIDPRTNRVAARLRVRAPDGREFAPLFVTTDGRNAWIVGRAGALRIDPERNAPDRFVRFGGEPVDATAKGERVLVLQPGGRLRELDARTGRLVNEIRLGGSGVAQAYPDFPGTLTVNESERVSLLDRSTGRVLWRKTFRGRVSLVGADGDALWVHVSRDPVARDQLIRLDSATGRQTGAVTLPFPGTVGMQKVGRNIWIATPTGTMMVVR
jgi:hypothetical protein